MPKANKPVLMMRVLSSTPNVPNRAQRRAQEHIRTSSPLCTKRNTLGRLTMEFQRWDRLERKKNTKGIVSKVTHYLKGLKNKITNLKK